MASSGTKVPAIIASSVICLALGVGAGIGTMLVFGYHLGAKPADDQAQAQGGAPMGSPGGSMPPGMGAPGGSGAAGRGGPGGGRGPSPKVQLASLVTKLDQISAKPIKLELNDEQKKKIDEQLHGLDQADELSDEDAKKRLDALLEVVKDQRPTLEDAGYRWPGQGGGFRPPADPPPNPFKDDANRQHLKSLEEQLTKGKA